MDGANTCATEPTSIPSIARACEVDASKRETLKFTSEFDELPGQLTMTANLVEITNDPAFFWLVSPGAEVPLK